MTATEPTVPGANRVIETNQHQHAGQEGDNQIAGVRGADHPERRPLQQPLLRPGQQFELAEHNGGPRPQDPRHDTFKTISKASAGTS